MLTLLWQLIVMLGCCLGGGSSLLFLIPKECSPLSKVFFSLAGGIFLAVLVPQNLIYLGVPVRISAWLLFGFAAFQLLRSSRRLGTRFRTVRSDPDIRTLGVIVLITATFHSVAPIRQGIDSYYGKAGTDQINYVFLAEFLKQVPYKTDFQEVGLKPWLLTGLNIKDQRIGQSVITAEISVLSCTNAKEAYAATFILSLAVLATCSYVLLREIRATHFVAGLGASVMAILPGITHLLLYGFLSQTAALFVFVFFATLLHRRELNGRGFTVFFSLGLAYLVVVYSEMAPIGFCCFLLGVIFVRGESFRQKGLTLFCGLLLVVLLNTFYIYNLIRFLSQQYAIALHASSLAKLLPGFLTLRDWSAVLFGPANTQWVPPPVYPITKLMFSFSPFAVVFVFSAFARLRSLSGNRTLELPKAVMLVTLVAAAALGSINEYRLVVDRDDSGLFREPGFTQVCRKLERIKNKKVLLFDTDQYILGWLCYHARNNDVYCDARAIGNATLLRPFPFSAIPKLDGFDLVVSRDQIIDPKATDTRCGILIDSYQKPEYENGKIRYWLGPPVHVRFLAFCAMSARIGMRLEPGPDAKTLPIRFSLSHDHNEVAQGWFSGETVEFRRVEIPRGFSNLELSVSAESVAVRAPSLPLHVAKLDGFQVSDISRMPGK